MSDHVWFQENLAAHLAGGLSPAEAERLEQHAGACPTCARTLSEAADMDRDFNALFASTRPGPALEDRMIRALRTASRYRPKLRGVYFRCATAAAAVLLLGFAGTFLSGRISQGEMDFPWEALHTRSDLLALGDIAATTNVWFHPSERASPSADEMAIDDYRGLTLAPLKDANQRAREEIDKLGDKLAGGTALFRDEPSNLSGKKIPAASSQGWELRSDPQPPSDQPSGKVATSSETTHSYRNDTFGRSSDYSIPSVSTGPVYGLKSNIRGGQVSGQDKTPDLRYFKPTGMPSSTVAVENKSRGTDADRQEKLSVSRSGDKADSSKETKDLFAQKNKEIKLAFVDKEGALPKVEGVPAAAPPVPAPAAARKIIRSGDIEFEVESFDTAVAAVTRLITPIARGFIATVNSEKLPNGKVRGSILVRLPPDRLDGFLLELRKELVKAGELKGQRIGSQDITKQFTDLESRLRAARAMEERLLQIIKTGKGEIKDLLLAEKELGVWRTRIEEQEGELRYFANQVALSTLNITVVEREIRAAVDVVATERVQMGLEVEDVEKAQREALAAVVAAKGRITRSELKQHGAGQFNAVLHFEVAPDAAGTVRDRLKQLGDLARLEVDRLMRNEGGSSRPTDDKVRRSDTVFQVSLYNLTNVAPRQSVQINLAALDVEAAYAKIASLGDRKTGRVVANLNRQHGDQTTGSVSLEVPIADVDAVLRTIKEAGEILRLQTSDNPDQQNSTRAKRGFVVQLVSLSMVEPQETETLMLAARDVPAEFRGLQEAVAKAKGRVLRAQLNEQDRQNIVADLDFDVRRIDEPAIRAALAAGGVVYSRSVTRAPESENKTDSKVRLRVQIVNVANLKPRETVLLAVEVTDVERWAAQLAAFAGEANGRTVESHQARERNGRVITRMVFEVPLAAAASLVERVKDAGTLRTQQSSRDRQAPDGELATARLDVTLSNTDLIVPSDQGLWPRVRQGLSTSFVALSWSLTVVIVGLFFVLPWAAAIYFIYWVALRLRRRPGATPTA